MNNCPICLEEVFKNPLMNSCECKQSYHSKCLKIWLHTNNNCPTCRQILSNIDNPIINNPIIETNTYVKNASLLFYIIMIVFTFLIIYSKII